MIKSRIQAHVQCSYPVTCVCTVREHWSKCVPRSYIDKRSRVFHTRAIVVHTPVTYQHS